MGAQQVGGLVDRFGRRAIDMRLSVIDKCNLRCTYCMPAEGLPWLKRDELMTADEIARLVEVAVHRLGVRELRLTGGEPLVRRDLEDIVARIRSAHPHLPLSLTTNGVGLDKRAADLKSAGLDRLNVSLDTLHADVFAEITRRPNFERVMAGLDAAAAAGLGPIKINAVLMRGINDVGAPEMVAWAIDRGFELRFIEQMPLDADRAWVRENLVTAGEIRERIAERFELRADPRERRGAPAERFEVFAPGGAEPLGVIGIIASVTEPFCADCTRTRVTADGAVRSCLFSHEETSLLDLVRAGADDEAIADRWRAAMWAKPKAHGSARGGLAVAEFVQPARSMSAIGG